MNEDYYNILLKLLLTYWWNLLENIFKIQIRHVYEEVNQCTDALAKVTKHGTYLLLLLFCFYHSLVVVEDLLALDRAANICNRLVFMHFSPPKKKKNSAVFIVGSQTKWYQNETKKHIDTRKESSWFLFFNNEPNRIKVPAV